MVRTGDDSYVAGEIPSEGGAFVDTASILDVRQRTQGASSLIFKSQTNAVADERPRFPARPGCYLPMYGSGTLSADRMSSWRTMASFDRVPCGPSITATANHSPSRAHSKLASDSSGQRGIFNSTLRSPHTTLE